MNWLLPENAATFGDIDALYYLILWITGAIFVVVQALLIYFIVKYRRRPGRKAEYIVGSTRAEIAWTAIPFFILLFLAFRSYDVWVDVRDPTRFPAPGLEIEVLASQFEWEATYPGPDGQLGTDDDFTVRNRLHVPVNTPVIVHLRSADVIHSFFVPAFRVKQDAVPGMVIPIWFEATRTGEFVLGCAELCGIGHYRMRGSVTVLTADEFARWQEEEAAGTR
jgi:cytochrome c oxidase subunit II